MWDYDYGIIMGRMRSHRIRHVKIIRTERRVWGGFPYPEVPLVLALKAEMTIQKRIGISQIWL